MPVGSCEVALPAGGDIQLQPNGDWVLAQDTLATSDATEQRLIRLILTNARFVDPNGNATMPDDICNPTYGSSARALVGQPMTDAIIGTLRANITSAISKDPTIAASPSPIVSVTRTATFTITVSVQVVTVTGQVVVIPSLALPG